MSQIMPLPPRSAGVSDLLEAAARLFRATLLKCLPQSMVAVLFAIAPQLYLQSKGIQLKFGETTSDPGFWWLYVLGSLAGWLLMNAVLVRQRRLVAGGSADLAAELKFAASRLPMIVACGLLASLAVIIGTFALVVPGIYLAVCVCVLNCVVLFESLRVPQVLLRCVQLIRPFWWRTCAALVIGLLVGIVCWLAINLVLSVIISLTGVALTTESRAILTTIELGLMATFLVFFSALSLVLYSAASNSA